MPPLTEFERSLRTGFFRKANGLLKGKTKKTASEVPMLSQVGNVMKSSGIEHRAEIVKRILMKGKPLNPAMKTSSAPPTSSHHGVPARKVGKIEVPQMDAASKISADMDLIKASLLLPKGGLDEAREMLKASVSQSFIAARQTGRLAKAMEAAGHSTTQVRMRGAAEAASLPKDTVKPKSLTHGLLRSHVEQFSKAVPKPAMMPA